MMTLSEQGLRDSIASVAQIRRVLAERRRDAEARLSQAEQEATELRKLESFAALQADELAVRLAAVSSRPEDLGGAL